jgi:Flp pilus assembly protein TadG
MAKERRRRNTESFGGHPTASILFAGLYFVTRSGQPLLPPQESPHHLTLRYTTMMRPVRVRQVARRGVAAVETACVLPVIVLFLVAVIDLGRLGKIADSVSNAARNGAQYGSTNTTTAADSAHIRAVAVTEMANLPKVTSSNPTVTATTVTYSSTKFIQVTVTYDMTGTSAFTLFPVGSMTRTVQMPMMPQ